MVWDIESIEAARGGAPGWHLHSPAAATGLQRLKRRLKQKLGRCNA